MESRCTELISSWLLSTEAEVNPSLLAHLLLALCLIYLIPDRVCSATTKSPTGLCDLTQNLASFWNQEHALKVPVLQVPSYSRKSLPTVDRPSTSKQKWCLLEDSAIVNVLVQFICDRLTDPSSVPRLLDVVMLLMTGDEFQSLHAIPICEALFSHVKSKKMPQSARHKLFTVLDHMLQNHATALQRSKVSFIGGFVSFMDGEKDPRNLLVAFEIVRVIIRKFDISCHVEDLFEVVFCYFPISFVPPPNDPYKITTEDLKDSLRRCLAATPYFAYYATPLLIEKLLTTTGSAKKDVMDTIGLCAPAYGAHAVLPHANDIFEALVKEVYKASDISMEHTALQTIHNVVATLGSGVSIANIRDPVEKAIDRLLSQCVENLKEPELKMAKSAAYILRAAASASDPASTSVAQVTIPLLYQQFRMTDPPSRHKAILDIFIEILEASKTLYGSVEDEGLDRDFQTPLLTYKQQILQVFVLALIQSATTDSGVRCSSLKGIRLMAVMKQFLSPEEMNVTTSHLTRQLSHEDKQTRSLALSILIVISKRNPSSLLQYTFPELLRHLPDSGNPNCSSYCEILDAIGQLAVNPAILISVAPSLVNKLDLVCCTAEPGNLEYACALATSIMHTFGAASKNAEIIKFGQELLFPRIVSGCVRSTLGHPNSWRLNDQLMELLAHIIAVIVRGSDSSYQKHLVDNAFRLFIDGDPSVVNIQSFPASNVKLFEAPSSLISGDSGVDITLLFPAIIGNCRKNVDLPVLSVRTFLQTITRLSLDVSCHARHLSLAKTAASVINKWLSDDVLDFITTAISTQLIPTLSSPSISARKSSLLFVTWLAKALVIRGHRLGYELLDSIMSQCGSPYLGHQAAESFAILLQEDKLILNKVSCATISILYKQRLFNHCLPKLLQGAEDPIEDIKVNYLVALSHMLINIPPQVSVNETPKLIPSMIASLSLNNAWLTLSMVEVAQAIISKAPDTLKQQNITFLINALVALTDPNRGCPTNVCVAVLKCLRHFAEQCKSEAIKSSAPMVVKKLGQTLDHRKRLVRKEAVDCREKWIAILS
ncbi:hypothetical protein DFQ29_001779 [Apophysomyces sp. BC1021]|nr:hypothetical protein DFQ29_001779 [Apophysomyces sp. BC1021]